MKNIDLLVEEISEYILKKKFEKKKIFATSSFQTQSVVLLHILSSMNVDFPIYFINTGYHFSETIEYKNQLTELLKLNVINLWPIIPKSEQRNSKGELLYASDPDRCCYFNKVQPLESILPKFDIWISGIRVDQTKVRENMKKEMKVAQGIVRYHPMLLWPGDLIEEYIRHYDLPQHPLASFNGESRISIGCEPCTKFTVGSSNKELRVERWAGLKKDRVWAAYGIGGDKMKILITGGTGYIGTELAAGMCQEKKIKEIIIYDNFSRTNYGLFMLGKLACKDKIRIIEGDILDSRKLRKLIKKVDTVIHLAAKVSTPYVSENHHGYDQVNHWGTAEVVYAIEESPNIKKFIHLSSTSVYGFSETEVDESSKVNSTMAYSISKFRAENHVKRLFNDGKRQVLIFRSGNVFGFSPSMRFDSVINRFAFNAKYLHKIIVYGLGDQVRPFIEVKDLVKVIEHGVLNDMSSEIYNVFDDNIKILRIAETLQEIFPEMELQYLNQHVSYGSLILKNNATIDGILTNKVLLKERILSLIDSLL